mgnify:CR=1 FL=1
MRPAKRQDATACRKSPFSTVEQSKKVAVFARKSKNRPQKTLYIIGKQVKFLQCGFEIRTLKAKILHLAE